MTSRRFQTALLISLFIHVIFLGVVSAFKVKKIIKPPKQIEVTYRKIVRKEISPEKKTTESLKALKPEATLPKRIEMLSRNEEQPTFFKEQLRDISKFSDKMRTNQKGAPQIEPRDLQRSIDIPFIKSDKITNPKYLSYNQSVRQKIRQRAYAHVDHPDFDSGEVYLTFVIASDGQLKDLQIIEQKTSANDYLREVGLRSIKESNPFPAFPKDLGYPELTFNVIISFEFND